MIALFHFFEQYLQITNVFLYSISLVYQFPDLLVLLVPFLLVLFKVSVEVEYEVECKFLVVFHHLLLLTIVLCPVYVHKQVLRLLTDE